MESISARVPGLLAPSNIRSALEMLHGSFDAIDEELRAGAAMIKHLCSERATASWIALAWAEERHTKVFVVVENHLASYEFYTQLYNILHLVFRDDLEALKRIKPYQCHTIIAGRYAVKECTERSTVLLVDPKRTGKWAAAIDARLAELSVKTLVLCISALPKSQDSDPETARIMGDIEMVALGDFIQK